MPADGSPVEIRLEAGREVLVIVEDELGRPLHATAIAQLPEGGLILSRETQPGHCLIEGVPSVSVSLSVYVVEADFSDRTRIRRELAADQTELRIVLPVSGRIEGQVTLPQGITPQTDCTIVFFPDDKELGARSWRVPSLDPPTSDFAIEEVFPGRYRVQVRCRDRTQTPAGDFEELGDPIWIEVESEQTTVVDLRP